MTEGLKIHDFPGTTTKRRVTLPSGSNGVEVVTTSGTQTLTNKTVTGAITSDTKRCSAQTDATSTTTLANVTGLTGFSLVAAGTYAFVIDLQTTCTTNGGIAVGFKYTTLTLTSIQVASTTVAAASLAHSRSTTTTDQTKFVNSNAAAWLNVRLTGTLVVSAAGTLDVQMAQQTSHADVSSVFVGSTATFTRLS